MMKKNVQRVFALTLIYFVIILPKTVGTFELNGQLSGWLTYFDEQPRNTGFGIRYIPEVAVNKRLSNERNLDFECSINGYRSGTIYSFDNYKSSGDVKLYRCWLRYSTEQFEARIGLQKINFGAASLLRPLMWFDSIDPRDPLQLTDGVYGLLGRYYFLNNANIWMWALYGNDKVKGWEIFPSVEDEPEFGGRIQVPFFNGEMAVTFHHRISKVNINTGMMQLPGVTLTENRFGFDGKWDYEIGFWFEGVIIHQDIYYNEMQYQKLATIGLDYTFGLGNGLNVVHEFFSLDISDKITKRGESISFSAMSLNYPVNIIDNISVMLYYDWQNENFYRFVNWQRLYNKWSIHIIGFWNPQQYKIYQNLQDDNFFTGKGLQLMIVFNH